MRVIFYWDLLPEAVHVFKLIDTAGQLYLKKCHNFLLDSILDGGNNNTVHFNPKIE